MIKFENVVFGYGEEKNALNYVSFHISEGEQVGLIGANGAGKSTLMKAMLGLIPAKGKITVDEIEVNQENSSRIWQCLRYVFQDSDNQMFMPTVYEDMIFGPLNYGKYDDRVYEKAKENLDNMEEKGILVQDQKACYYIYELVRKERTQTGIVGCSSIDDYMNGVVKKHELTREDKEQDRIHHVDSCNANTGPIFLACRYPDSLLTLMNNWKDHHEAAL